MLKYEIEINNKYEKLNWLLIRLEDKFSLAAFDEKPKMCQLFWMPFYLDFYFYLWHGRNLILIWKENGIWLSLLFGWRSRNYLLAGALTFNNVKVEMRRYRNFLNQRTDLIRIFTKINERTYRYHNYIKNIPPATTNFHPTQ